MATKFREGSRVAVCGLLYFWPVADVCSLIYMPTHIRLFCQHITERYRGTLIASSFLLNLYRLPLSTVIQPFGFKIILITAYRISLIRDGLVAEDLEHVIQRKYPSSKQPWTTCTRLVYPWRQCHSSLKASGALKKPTLIKRES